MVLLMPMWLAGGSRQGVCGLQVFVLAAIAGPAASASYAVDGRAGAREAPMPGALAEPRRIMRQELKIDGSTSSLAAGSPSEQVGPQLVAEIAPVNLVAGASPQPSLSEGMPEVTAGVLPHSLLQAAPQAVPLQALQPAMPQAMPQGLLATWLPGSQSAYVAPPPGWSLVYTGSPPTVPAASSANQGGHESLPGLAPPLQGRSPATVQNAAAMPTLSVGGNVVAMPTPQHGPASVYTAGQQPHDQPGQDTVLLSAAKPALLPHALEESIKASAEVRHGLAAAGVSYAERAPRRQDPESDAKSEDDTVGIAEPTSTYNKSLSPRRRRITVDSVPQTAAAIALGSISGMQPTTALRVADLGHGER